MKLWLRSLRVYSFTASITPVIITYLYIISNGEDKDPLLFMLCSFFIILIHSWVNVWNEYYDFKNNVDDNTSNGSTLLIQNNLLSSRFFFVSGIIYFLLSFYICIIFFIFKRSFITFIFNSSIFRSRFLIHLEFFLQNTMQLEKFVFLFY